MNRFSVARSRRPLRLIQLITVTFTGLAMIAATLLVTADTQSTQALFNIDLGAVPSPAGITFFGASGSDHLSGNNPPATFSTFPRAHAIVTGDFNRDGSLDIAIGAPDADFAPAAPATARPNAGAVYILFGRSTFAPGLIIDTNLTSTTQPDIKIFGANADDNIGFSLAVGDVNGDGGDDLIIGAPGFDPTTGAPATQRPDAGAAYVLFGSTSLTVRTIDLSTANPVNIQILGEHAGDRFGSAMTVGDVNGGTPATAADLLVGAPGSSGPDPVGAPRNGGGAAFLLAGGEGLSNANTTIRIIDLSSTPASFRIYGKAASQLGSSVAIGDINSGGAPDIIVGAPKANRPEQGGDVIETGAVFAVFGGNNILPTPPATTKVIDINQTQQNVSIYGATAGDNLGASVATGNVRGGGVIDLIMGAPNADGLNDSRVDAGEVYILAGSAGLNDPNDPPAPGTPTQRRIDVSLGTVNLTVFGAQAGDHLGSTVAAGLVNTQGDTDAIADVLIGAPGFSSNKGAVYALFGGPNLAFFAVRDIAIGQDDLRVSGQAAGDELGWAIATGDIDNNRGGDLIVGAPFADAVISQGNTRTDAGKVYVLLASNDVVPPLNINPIVTVVQPNGNETLLGGSNFDIKWTASDQNGDLTLQRFEIRLSTDSGATFNTIIQTNLDGAARDFNWLVPSGLNTTMARIRVTAFDNAGGTGQDASDNNFTITDAGIGVSITAPLGGETLIQGKTFNITWTVPEDLKTQVKGFDIFFAPDGVNFTVQITPVNPTQPALGPDVRTFPWVVPNLCVTAARVLIRTTSITNAVSTKISNPFAIAEQGPTVDTTQGNIFFNSSGTKLNFRITTIDGVEVRFEDGVKVEISNDAGTLFFEVNKAKKKNSGKKLQTKGTVSGQDIGVFFPDGATRLVRITNPTCGVTVLRLKRVGDLLVPANLPIDGQSVRNFQ